MTLRTVVCADGLPERWDPPDAVVVIEGLCDHPGRLVPALDGASGVVVGVCADTHVRGRIQAAVRRAGLDALGAGLVELPGRRGDAGHLRAVLDVAASRAAAYGGSSAANHKPVIPTAVSRRSLLRLELPEYVAVPAVDGEACVAVGGCRACAETCPADAFSRRGGPMALDADACITCGRCVTACPTGAIENPAITPASLAAEVEAIARQGEGGPPVVLTYACAAGEPAELVDGSFVVRVPCVAMLTTTWVLAPLLAGVAAVRVAACEASGCARGGDGRAADAVEAARAVLAVLGLDGQHVSARTPEHVPAPLSSTLPPGAFGPRGATAVVLALADAAEAQDVPRVEHRALDTGIVTVDGAACTTCGACAGACPTGALTFASADGAVALGFAARDCVACGQCVPRCPELARGAIAMTPTLDLEALRADPVVLKRDQMIPCENCGRPIASVDALQRVGALLGEEHAGALALAGRFCTTCRQGPFGVRATAAEPAAR